MKLFNIWETEKIEVKDSGLKQYINLDPVIAPSSGGKHVKTRFWKVKTPVVERLANKIMVTGHLKEGRVHKRVSGRDTGKKLRAYNIVKSALEKIEEKTKQNPVQILVNAIQNTAPIEETTSFRQGGIIARKAVDASPQRRLDLSLRFITHGAGQRAFKKKQSISDALADEILAAAMNDNKSYSVAKKEEIERVAAGAR